MPGAYKRPTDKRRGKAGKWTGWYFDEHGKRRKFAGSTDKGATLELARAKETECRLIVQKLIDPKVRKSREATARPIEDHVQEYRDYLLAKGDTTKHADHVRGVVRRLLAKAAIESTAGLAADPIQGALGRMKVADGKAAGTCNFAIQAIKAFIGWLADDGRIQSLPEGLKKIRPYNAEADRRRERRALTSAELERLLDAAELGPTIVARRDGRGGKPSHLTGPDRAMLYRLAMWTGFRANELRTLQPEFFAIEGDDPAVVVKAAYAKNGQETRQPIPRESAKWLRPWLEGREVGKPILPVPERTAEMLRADLEAAGIPYRDGQGRVVDFHALRMSFITKLVRDGVNPKLVQKLARHSTITLTLGTYTHVEDDELRRAMEGEK